MADKSFKVKNSIVIQGVELDLSGATPNQVLSYDGTKFSASTFSAPAASVGESPPLAPVEGTLWYDSSSGILLIYYDSTWVQI
jgi:hypothetical protein